MNDATEAARQYLANGWAPLPFEPRTKGPTYPGWQNYRANGDAAFAGKNIGVLDGQPSNGLVDCDLDCLEALRLARLILPPTEAMFGRESKPRSHWLYRCQPPPEQTKQFQFEKGMLVELRSTGGQTMFPPSIHPSGETVRWDIEGRPAEVAPEQLLRAMGDLAALCLLARNWPEPHGRYNAEGALIGALLRSGRPEDEVVHLVSAIRSVAGAARSHKPEKSVPRLAKMLADGKPVPGLRRLRELLGKEIADKAAEWLGIRRHSGSASYEQRADGIYWMLHKADAKGVVEVIPIKLCNFAAEIVEVVTLDDGSDDRPRRFIVEGERGRVEVPADEFDAMTWVTAHWGPWASIEPGRDMKARCAQALKALSEETAERTVYQHTGWRHIDGRWLYLHAGGAIGADGPVEDIAVDLGGELAHVVLPPIRDLKAAVQTSLLMIDLNVTVAAAAWRAPLIEFCPVHFSVFDTGPTGTLKSAAQGVGMAHWGVHWDGVKFPANWSSTAYAIERVAFLAKDVLCVIDDFAPRGGQRAVAELHSKAEHVFRGAGNLAGRQRLRADTSARVTYYPRGLLASSGEDVPGGQSLRARLVITNIAPDDIDPRELTPLQEAGRAGVLAEATAGYVRWIAGQADGQAEVLRQRQAAIRAECSSGNHRRTPANVAALGLGVDMFLAFAEAIEAVDADERAALWQQAWSELQHGATGQQKEQQEEDPVRVFVEAIPEVLAAGRAHVAERSGEPPEEANTLGRQRIDRPAGPNDEGQQMVTIWQARGERIGWIVESQLWLLPEISLSVVNRALREQGGTIAVRRNTLGKRLQEAGQIVETDPETHTKQCRVGDGKVRVWVLSAAAVLGVSQEAQP